MKRVFVFLLFLPFISEAQVQPVSALVIGSAGTYAESTSGSISWTVGELMTQTYSSSSDFFTQGFHQPKVLFAISAIDNKGEKISVYPNPVVDHVLVDFSGAEGNHLVEIFDMRGQLLKRELVVDKQKQIKISFLEYANGIYLINVIDKDSNSHSSYKINKSE